MTPETLFPIHLVFGYVAWSLCFANYVFPFLRRIDRTDAFRMIATLHSFRFFGLVFLLPGVVGTHLPEDFAVHAAYGDFAAGLLAMSALATVRWPALFRLFLVAFNVVGISDLFLDYYNAIAADLPKIAGELGAAYAIPILYVPILMMTHLLCLYWLWSSFDRRHGLMDAKR